MSPKLNENQIKIIKLRHELGATYEELAKEFNVTLDHVRRIVTGKRRQAVKKD